jgi:DNA repair protein RadD
MKHGLPDDDREWTLEGHKRNGRKKEADNLVNIRQCPKCYFVHKPLPICPGCGYAYTVAERMPEVKDGELVEIDKKRAQKKRSYEEYKCDTYEDFLALGKARGYKGAHAWAKLRAGLREKRRRA